MLASLTALLATEASSPTDPDTGLLLIAVLGVVAFAVGQATRQWISEVIVFLAIGIIAGPEVLDLVDGRALDALEPVIAVALGAIVFGISQRLEWNVLRRLRHTLTPMAVVENVAVFVLVLVGLVLVGMDLEVAYLLAAIALSTSPTTVVAVIAERRAAGRFTDHVLSLTALNNVTSAIAYGLGLPIVLATRSPSGLAEGALAFAQLIVGGVVIGLLGALVFRTLAPRIDRAGERLLFVLVVLVAIVAVSRAAGAPVVLSTLVAGALLANSKVESAPLFESLRTLEAPIFLVFFLVAGAGVHLEELASVGWLGVVFVLGRTAGKVGGAWIGTDLTRSGRRSGWAPIIGGGLMPFAGMAIGLAAFTLEKASAAGLDQLGSQVSAITLGAVVIFELAGPVTVAKALDRAGDSGKATESASEATLDAPHLVRHILVPISSPEMARRKAPQIVDLAASAGAAVTALHIVPPGQDVDPQGDASLSYVGQIAAARGITFEPVVRTSSSVVDAIVEEAVKAAVDVVVLGEPLPRRLDRGGARRIVHDVAERLPDGVRVFVVPTVLDEAPSPVGSPQAEAGAVPGTREQGATRR